MKDKRTDLKLAKARTKKVILEDEVTAAIGHLCSAHRDAMIEISKEYKIPLLQGTYCEGGCCYSTIPDHYYFKPFIHPFIGYNAKSFYLPYSLEATMPGP